MNTIAFDASEPVALNKQKILEIIRNNLSLEDIEHSFIYWDKKLLRQGDEIRSGSQTVIMPFDGTCSGLMKMDTLIG